MVAGLGFEVLKQLGGLIVGAASHNVVYGTFAATVGVLIWISYMSKWILFVGAWALVDAQPELEPGAAPGGGGHPHGDPAVLPPAVQGHQAHADGEAAGDAGHEPQRDRQG